MFKVKRQTDFFRLSGQMMAKGTSLRRPGRSKRPGRASDQFIVRLPDGMRARITEIAADTRRSMNAVVVEALVLQLDRVGIDATPGEILARIEAVEIKVEKLESKVQAHDEQLHPYDYSDLK